jgi:TonB family protein
MPVSDSRIEGSRKQSGTVRIGCRLAGSGDPEDCVVTRRVAPLLDEAALAGVLGSRYTPLTVNGVPHPALVELSVRFTERFRTEPSERADPSSNLVEELPYRGREYDVRDP